MHFGEKLGHSKQKNSMGILSSLTREQKEAVGLLQIGTFLEYFDLMLYVHMAVLLNELFFPKTDPQTAALLTAFAFCSTYVLRPFGALLFGWIGDNIGRKTTVIITTMMMSVSCVIMANLPTYAQIGISAAWIVTICRITQGLSSMGEIMGAEIYLTEITKPPIQYPTAALPSLAAAIGGMAALGISVLVTTYEGNWRIAFWIGAGVAVIGSMARTRLRETPEFIEGKRKRQKNIEKFYTHQEKINKKTFIFCLLIFCGWPVSFYLGFMYFNQFLKSLYGYSAEDIIVHNLFLSVVMVITEILVIKLSYKVHPLKILKVRGFFGLVLLMFLPLIILNCHSIYSIFITQSLLLIFHLAHSPAPSVIIKNFPIFKRFTATSFSYASTRATMYIITSFGLIYLTESFGHYGLWFITVPIAAGFLWGVNHFVKLEKASGNFPSSKKPDELIIKC